MQGTPQVINAGGVVNQSRPCEKQDGKSKDNFRLAVDQAVANETGALLRLP